MKRLKVELVHLPRSKWPKPVLRQFAAEQLYRALKRLIRHPLTSCIGAEKAVDSC